MNKNIKESSISSNIKENKYLNLKKNSTISGCDVISLKNHLNVKE